MIADNEVRYSEGMNAEYQKCRAISAAIVLSGVVPRIRSMMILRQMIGTLWSFNRILRFPE